jgi:hypothetical protein
VVHCAEPDPCAVPDHSEAVAEAASHPQAHELLGQQQPGQAPAGHTPGLVAPVLCGGVVGVGCGVGVCPVNRVGPVVAR